MNIFSRGGYKYLFVILPFVVIRLFYIRVSVNCSILVAIVVTLFMPLNVVCTGCAKIQSET